MKLVEDRKVCWQDQYEGWHVGVTFLRDGRPVRGGEGTLVRHKHTGELEMVNDHWLKDYPMEPIPEPGVKTTNFEDWKRAFESAKKTGVVQVKDGMLSDEQIKAIARAQLDHDLNNRMASTPTWPREKDIAWEEGAECSIQAKAAADMAEKLERIKAMEEALSKWKPVKPKLSDLYRETRHLCIGILTKE